MGRSWIRLKPLKMEEPEAAPEKKKAANGNQILVEEVSLRKRLPRGLPRRDNDVYISRSTPEQLQLIRCQKLLDKGVSELWIHGLGAAVQRAICISLQLQQSAAGSLDIHTYTNTVELIDDLEPSCDGDVYDTQTRNNSAVHIRLFRPGTPLPQNNQLHPHHSKNKQSNNMLRSRKRNRHGTCNKSEENSVSNLNESEEQSSV